MRELLVIRQVSTEIPQSNPDQTNAGNRQHDSADEEEPNELSHAFAVCDRPPYKRPTTVPSTPRGSAFICSIGVIIPRCFAGRRRRPPHTTCRSTGREETIVTRRVTLYIEDREKPLSLTGRRAR